MAIIITSKQNIKRVLLELTWTLFIVSFLLISFSLGALYERKRYQEKHPIELKRTSFFDGL